MVLGAVSHEDALDLIVETAGFGDFDQCFDLLGDVDITGANRGIDIRQTDFSQQFLDLGEGAKRGWWFCKSGPM